MLSVNNRNLDTATIKNCKKYDIMAIIFLTYKLFDGTF